MTAKAISSGEAILTRLIASESIRFATTMLSTNSLRDMAMELSTAGSRN